MVLLFSINIQAEYVLICKNKLCVIVPGRQGKNFCLQGILEDINEKDTSFLDYKHNHWMKSGAPPDKFGVLPRYFL